ncbi:MAG: hypothetical protein FWC86_05945 [Coriobacteriia bacterium]|nr:hypothetical protein [Coriobacteriia bacterium]
MQLRPAIIIPTFWTRSNSTSATARPERESGGRKSTKRKSSSKSSLERSFDQASAGAPFSHPTALDNPKPPLVDCLSSLANLKDVNKIVLVVATTDSTIDVRADDRVREIAEQFPQLDILIFGTGETSSLFRRLEQMEMHTLIEALSIKSYGATRNLGCLVASILGFDSLIFIDDDEIVDDPDFMSSASFGLGQPIHSGGYLFAKSGMITDMTGDFYQMGTGHLKQGDQADKASLNKLMPRVKGHWADFLWKDQDAINQTIAQALKPPRMHRSTIAYGGCLAIHREMFTKVAFDPWIMRGEDVDYVINARMHGGDIYIDDQWIIRHNSPKTGRNSAERFRQNIYRLIYEHRKIEFAKSQVDLAQVTAQSLMPFPGSRISTAIPFQAFATGLLRTVSGPHRGQYWRAAWDALGKANAYARRNCNNYFELQRLWPRAVEKLSSDVALKSLVKGERGVDYSAMTGTLKIPTR